MLELNNIGFRETLTVEFKSDIKRLPDNDIIDVVVAFSNTDGGELYLGVEDDGTVTGLHESHRDATQLAAFIANKTVPPVSVRSEIIDCQGISVLKVSIPRKTSIVASASGKILRRRLKTDGTPENVPLYPYEIVNRLSSLRLLDFSAQPVPDAVYEDLDPLEREHLRNIIRSYHGDSVLLELTDEELDRALQLITTVDGRIVPTYTGLLLIGRSERLKALMPTAESTIQVLSGTDVRVNESFTLPILTAFEKINSYISAWNTEVEMDFGLYRVSIPDIDPRAFREALVNAYCHRDYSLLGRVRVQLNEEGLVISNPGGFIEGISIDNLLKAEPHGRNPVLADALKRLGLAERTGRGIDRIYEGSLLYGRLLPDYSESNSRSVQLFIPKGLPDRAFVRMLSEEQQRIGRSLPIYSLLVLNSLKQFRRATVHELSMDIHTEENKIRVTLESLHEAGLVEAGGTGRGRYYFLSSKVYQTGNNMLGYVRQTGIDTLRYEEMILKLARQQGYVTRANVAELLSITLPQAYRLLQKLVDEEQLALVCKGRYAKYALIEK